MRDKIFFFFVGFLLVFPCRGFAYGDENDILLNSAQQTLNEYRREAEVLAAWCEAEGLESQAKLTRDFVMPIEPDCIHIPIIPRKKLQDFLPAESSASVVQWHHNWMTIRRNLSLKLQEHAKMALQQERVILAMQMIHIALHADPDSQKLRNVLGFEFYDGQWRTDWEIKQLKLGKVDHEQFGWIPAKYVERYEAGERFYKKDSRSEGKWVSKGADALLHAEIDKGWVISSEHYDVRTNHSLEEGVRLSRYLEVFYYVWKQVFIQYTASTSELTQQLDGKRSRYKEPRLKVVFFKDRENYLETLEKNDPNVGVSVGFYDDPTRTCYFYMHDGTGENSEGDMFRTVFHEGTHQLFNCAKPVQFRDRGHFWATEAIAIYMETLRRDGNYYVLGNAQDIRVLAAKYRFFESKFYMPIENLTKLSMRTFQNAPYLKELYSQCGGMAYFFMHHDKGEYRDRFVTYLDAIYSGYDSPDLLFRMIGEKPETLDEQYEQMLKAIPAEFKNREQKSE